MRYTFGQELIKYMEADPTIYLICCDIGFGVFDEVKAKFPNRILNTGIAEQATVGLASGMAMEGLKPIVYTITPFLLERPFEVIKLNVVQQKQNVKLVSYGDYPDLGPTHITSDVKKLCECLKLKLYQPEDLNEMLINLKEIMESNEPSFLYLKKAK
jgi:transketolase